MVTLYSAKENKMTRNCNNLVTVSYRHDGSEIQMTCRSQSVAYGYAMCEACEAEIKKAYPQGFRYYPGDTCKHGVYVGGCAEDFMCFKCEMGDDEDDEDMSQGLPDDFPEDEDEDSWVTGLTDEDYNSNGDYDTGDSYDSEYDRY